MIKILSYIVIVVNVSQMLGVILFDKKYSSLDIVLNKALIVTLLLDYVEFLS